MQIELTSRGLLTTFFRHRRKIMSIFFLCFSIGLIYALVAKPTYDSVGSLLIKFGRDARPEIAKSNALPIELSQNDRREIMQSNIQILESRDLLRSLVNEFGLKRLYPEIAKNLKPGESGIETAIDKLQRDAINIHMALNSDIIEVHMLHQDPKLAADFLHRLFDSFMTRQSDVFDQNQTDFLAEQIQQASEKLHQSQKAFQDYKTKNRISSIDEELKRLLEQKMNAGQIALTALDKTKARLEDLQAEETRLLATYQADSPAVIKLRQSIAKAQQQVAERQNDLTAKDDTKTTTATIVSAEVSRIDRRIKTLEELSTRHNDLERQVTIDEENYKNFVARGESARVNSILTEQKVSRTVILDTPMVPDRPARPRKTVVMILAMLAGAILGLGAALISETSDDRFSTPSQLKQTLHLPVMASFFLPRMGR